MPAKTQLNVWVDPDLRDALKARAEAQDVSVGEIVRQAVAGVVPAKRSPVDDVVDRVTNLGEAVGYLEGFSGDLEKRLSRLEEMAGL